MAPYYKNQIKLPPLLTQLPIVNASIPLSLKTNTSKQARFASISNEPTALTDIYKEEINIAIWQRVLGVNLLLAVEQLITTKPNFQLSMSTSPENVQSNLQSQFKNYIQDTGAQNVFIDDIANIVDMFCCLFELSAAGLRMAALDQAMCPRFHVDRVPARLVTTYSGMATEWLTQQSVDRSKLGPGSQGKEDHLSGLYQSDQDIQRLNTADVALLKGELWEGNENAGLVHRSPALKPGEHRLLLTLDFMA